MTEEETHDDPIWRDRANFIIGIAIPDATATEPATEQLWARQLGPFTFEICCIPFFVYDLALGDIVETDEDYTVRQVSLASDRYVFRVYFPTTDHSFHNSVKESVESMGGQIEWRGSKLMAIDVENRAKAAPVADMLAELEAKGKLHYETGLMSHR